MPYNPLTANKFYFSTVEDELELRDGSAIGRRLVGVEHLRSRRHLAKQPIFATEPPDAPDNIHIGDIVITVVRTPPQGRMRSAETARTRLRYDAHTPRAMG